MMTHTRGTCGGRRCLNLPTGCALRLFFPLRTSILQKLGGKGLLEEEEVAVVSLVKKAMRYYGGIEAGGSKFLCAIARDPDKPPIASLRIPTTRPEETLAKVVAFFDEYHLKALGIACFGPIDLRRGSPTYGFITETPKLAWKHTNIAGLLGRTLSVPVGFDTDVNAAALAEARYGAARGLDYVGYFTVGTGIGGGAVIKGEMIHGLVHPEMGHIPVPRHPHDSFRGCCPFHGDCLEGMASGLAIKARWKRPAGSLPPDHVAWELEAYYLSRAVCVIVYTISPERVILGGGVMENHRHLFPAIRRQVVEALRGYVQSDSIIHHVDDFIVEPALGNRSGITGALELARLAGDRAQEIFTSL
jgi:fructokinase